MLFGAFHIWSSYKIMMGHIGIFFRSYTTDLFGVYSLSNIILLLVLNHSPKLGGFVGFLIDNKYFLHYLWMVHLIC